MNIIFTCLIDNYDSLHEIKLEEGWRAICFTNTDIRSDSWEIVRIEKTSKVFRDIKTRPHVHLPKHDKSVWIDANLELKISLSELVKDKNGFWLMQHPDRKCVYEEAKRCIELKKDKPDVITRQMQRYLLSSYPHNNGLSATGVIIRDYNGFNIVIGDAWWKEIKNGSVRDQLSFNYVAWRYALKFNMFPFLQGFNYYYHSHKIKQMEEREEKRRLEREARMKNGGHVNREERAKKLWARKTAAYYKLYGNGQNGDNSRTY